LLKFPQFPNGLQDTRNPVPIEDSPKGLLS